MRTHPLLKKQIRKRQYTLSTQIDRLTKKVDKILLLLEKQNKGK